VTEFPPPPAPTRPAAETPADRVGWVGVALVAAAGAVAALLEAFLVPLYVGSAIVPVAVLLAVAGNVALPRMARTLVPRTGASLVPLLTWLAVMLGLLLGRPEGDVVFPGAPQAAEWTFYGTLFGGALAGLATVALSVPPPVRREDPAADTSR
jgi:hypothetical protein